VYLSSSQIGVRHSAAQHTLLVAVQSNAEIEWMRSHRRHSWLRGLRCKLLAGVQAKSWHLPVSALQKLPLIERAFLRQLERGAVRDALVRVAIDAGEAAITNDGQARTLPSTLMCRGAIFAVGS